MTYGTFRFFWVLVCVFLRMVARGFAATSHCGRRFDTGWLHVRFGVLLSVSLSSHRSVSNPHSNPITPTLASILTTCIL